MLLWRDALEEERGDGNLGLGWGDCFGPASGGGGDAGALLGTLTGCSFPEVLVTQLSLAGTALRTLAPSTPLRYLYCPTRAQARFSPPSLFAPHARLRHDLAALPPLRLSFRQ